MTVNIFEQGKELKGNKFEFNKVGDKIQGTFVSKSQIPSRYNQREMVNIYELKDESGEYWTIWGKQSIDRNMKHVKLGQIIGFVLTAINPSKSGGNDFKDVRVIADPNIVDEEWLREQDMMNAEEVVVPPGKDPIDAAMEEMVKGKPTVVTPQGNTDKLARINVLATQKLGVTNPDEIMQKVMESTNMAWLPSNFDDIIKKLEAI